MTEPMYPLSVARKIVKREECDREGHDIENCRARNAAGHLVYDFYRCTRCDVTITLVYPALDGTP